MMLLYSSLCVLLAARATWASPAITLPPASIITPAPLIPRAIDYSFIGYEMSGGAAVSTWFCKSQTFTFSSGFAGCALYGYEIVTTCSGTLAIGASNTASCLNYCATHSVYRSQGDKSPAQWIDCAEKPGRLQLFRETVPATSTLFTTTESVPYLPPTFSTSISPSTSPVLASSTAPSSPTNVSSGSSKAPIIGGAVAGSLIFLGLIGAGAFFFFTKRRANAPNAPYHAPDQAIAMSNAPPSSPPPPFHDQTKNYTAGIPVGTDGKQAQVAEYQVPGMTYSELDGQSAPAAAAPMHAYGQSSPGAVDPNMNRRSELA